MTSAAPTPSLLYAVKQVELAVRAHLDALLKPAGLTTTQYTALTVLQRRTSMSAAQLARNSFVTAQSMQDVVLALLDRGLIARAADPNHGKRLLITLTEEGERVLGSVQDAVNALDRQMTSLLTEPEREGLRYALNSCRAALR